MGVLKNSTKCHQYIFAIIWHLHDILEEETTKSYEISTVLKLNKVILNIPVKYRYIR